MNKKSISKVLTVCLALVLFIAFGVESIKTDAATDVKLKNTYAKGFLAEHDFYVTTWLDGKIYGIDDRFWVAEVKASKGVKIKKISYSSKNTKIARVNEKGRGQIVGPGNTDIVVKVNYKKGKKNYTKKLNYEVRVKEIKLAKADSEALDAIYSDQKSRGAEMDSGPFDNCEWGSVSGDSASWRIKEFCMLDHQATGDLSLNELKYLERVEVSSPHLRSIDVSGLKNLKELDCSSNDDLTTLNASDCSSLEWIFCESNNSLTSLNLSNNTALKRLSCGYNALTSLDVSDSAMLEVLYCGYNKISSLDLRNNIALTELYCANNSLISLDVSNCLALESIECDDNGLTSIDVSNSPMLRSLRCGFNNITSLDVTHNTELGYLNISENSIKYIDVSNCKKLDDFSYDYEEVEVIGWN